MAGSSNFITFFILSISVCVKQCLCANFLVGRHFQVTHPVDDLSEKQLSKYGKLENMTHLRDAVKNILIPRVAGTKGHVRVRDYISHSIQDMGWSFEWDEFYQCPAILGIVHFHTIIATLKPHADRYLVLTCHYDSRFGEHTTFLGAIHAVPCAMLLNIAKVLQNELQQFRRKELSLMFIFFDGHEPPQFYDGDRFPFGARNLARRWAEYGTLNKLDMLISLDMIGLDDTTFRSFFANTNEWFDRFTALEERLSFANKLYRCRKPKHYFEPDPLHDYFFKGDHTPFKEQSVPILHLTPERHPRVWHTKEDNESKIDYEATEDISRIIRLFIMEYLLSGINKKNKCKAR
ncbi:glutaminyl-peptide cyclotransferase-like [Eurosta solidaginis]|uniref:glutaminyl-peptide cyclotransferase-like n=1 Tax=Eurosta solidaginis TaxID=178769 RepID=UPI003530D10B